MVKMSEDLSRKKSDYLLELALEEQLEQDAELEKYKSNDALGNTHIFSDEHNRRMEKICKLADKMENKPKRLRKYRQMAAGFAVILCISAYSVTQVEAFRLPMMRFFIEVKEKSTLFGTNRDEGITFTEHLTEYEPHYVPDGFNVEHVDESDNSFIIKYVNVQNKQSYRFMFNGNIGDADVDTEDGVTKRIEINGNQAYIVHEGTKIQALMNKDSHQFFLTGDISYDEAIKIMESIK